MNCDAVQGTYNGYIWTSGFFSLRLSPFRTWTQVTSIGLWESLVPTVTTSKITGQLAAFFWDEFMITIMTLDQTQTQRFFWWGEKICRLNGILWVGISCMKKQNRSHVLLLLTFFKVHVKPPICLGVLLQNTTGQEISAQCFVCGRLGPTHLTSKEVTFETIPESLTTKKVC